MFKTIFFNFSSLSTFLLLCLFIFLLTFIFYQCFFILSGTRTPQSDGIAPSAVLGLSTEDRRRPGIDPGSHQQIMLYI